MERKGKKESHPTALASMVTNLVTESVLISSTCSKIIPFPLMSRIFIFRSYTYSPHLYPYKLYKLSKSYHPRGFVCRFPAQIFLILVLIIGLEQCEVTGEPGMILPPREVSILELRPIYRKGANFTVHGRLFSFCMFLFQFSEFQFSSGQRLGELKLA